MHNDPTQIYVADAVGNDGNRGPQKASLKSRAISEAKKFFIITLYLWVFFAMFSLHRTLILEKYNLSLEDQSFAIVNAFVLAKVMLIAEDLHLGRRFEHKPLIYSVLWSSMAFAVVLVAFHVLEHAAIAWLTGRPVAESLAGANAGTLRQVLSTGALAFVALLPFFAFHEVARVVGSGPLWQLFFTRGRKTFTLLVQE